MNFSNNFEKIKEKEKQSSLQETSNILKCKEYILSRNGTLKGLNTEQEYNYRATRLKRAELIEEELEKEIIKIDFCDSCQDWNPSVHRCSCGNRRCTWDYDGTFLEDSVVVYPVPY